MDYWKLIKNWNPEEMTDEEYSFFWNTLRDKIKKEEFLTDDEIFILTAFMFFPSQIQYNEPCGYNNLIYCDYIFKYEGIHYIISGTFNEHDGFNFEGQAPKKAVKKNVKRWFPIKKKEREECH